MTLYTNCDLAADTGAVTSPRRLPGHLCGDPASLMPVVEAFAMRIPADLLSRMQGPQCPLAKQFIPDPRELQDPCTDGDPLAEELQSPAPLIVHRYPYRVIFLVSNQCAAYCRFCMRKRRVRAQGQTLSRAVAESLAYIHQRKDINEVILSGGDPLMLSDSRLEEILGALRQIAHVKILRIHTRMPCVQPRRITSGFARLLASFHPLFINVHCNHPLEITGEAARALSRLADAGIPMGSQSVLLKDVNDRTETLHRLMEELLVNRVKPYYLHQIDRVPGTAHFRVSMEQALELMAGLRGRLSGMAMPHFMIDLPGGGGKMELLPESIVEKKSDHWIIRNFQGRIFRYPVG